MEKEAKSQSLDVRTVEARVADAWQAKRLSGLEAWDIRGLSSPLPYLPKPWEGGDLVDLKSCSMLSTGSMV